MHPIRKQRLIIVLAIVVASSIAAALIAYALRDNLNLFYEPVRVAAGEAPIGKKIRVGGMVLEGSIQRNSQSLKASFVLTDYQAQVAVEYEGILPDLFAENAGAVATGKLNSDGVFIADQVLAKHDEEYMPPEVAKALEAGRKNQASQSYDINRQLDNESP